MAHRAALVGETPRVTSTTATPRPSGMLWNAIASVMSSPRLWSALSFEKETPTPDLHPSGTPVAPQLHNSVTPAGYHGPPNHVVTATAEQTAHVRTPSLRRTHYR